MILLRRRILENVAGDTAVRDFVLAHFHRHRRHRRHWLNAGNVDLGKLLDEGQHGIELALKVRNLILGNRNARQMRNPADSLGVNRHGGRKILE